MKMKVLFTICSVLVSIVCVSQVATPLHFQDEIFDFGVVDEEGGAVVHDFRFTNNSLEPVRIISVQASCGCTTPAWTKDPIDPGMTGFIQASFNPKGRPGYFNKSLSVTTSTDSNPIVLQIKGQVSSGEGSPTANAEFRSSNGNWKLRSGSFNLGKVYMTDGYSVRDFQILNGGKKVIKYTGEFVGPSYIKVDVQPLALAPGEKGHVKISYNGKMKGVYGFQSDNVEIVTDDELSPTKSFSVYASLEDDFEDLSPEEIANAAQLRLREQEVDFGRIRPNETSVKEIQFLNSGKATLDIRSVKGNCTCISASARETSLEPGETGTIKIEFNPRERKGTQHKAVTVYSNDPKNPVQRLIFTAYVED